MTLASGVVVTIRKGDCKELAVYTGKRCVRGQRWLLHLTGGLLRDPSAQ